MEEEKKKFLNDIQSIIDVFQMDALVLFPEWDKLEEQDPDFTELENMFYNI